jgi:hypothetical protein
MNVGLTKVAGTNNFKFNLPSMVPDQGNLITVDNLTHTKVDLSVGEPLFLFTCRLGVHESDRIFRRV